MAPKDPNEVLHEEIKDLSKKVDHHSDRLHDKLDESYERLNDKLDETNKCVGRLDKNFAIHIKDDAIALKRIGDGDEKQNQLLAEHMEGTKTLRKLYTQCDTRLTAVEVPHKWFSITWRLLLALGGGAAAIHYILKLFTSL